MNHLNKDNREEGCWEMSYINKEQLDEALHDYFVRVHDISDIGWEHIKLDFKDPYDCEWIRQEYDDTVEVDGIDYEMRECWTDFGPFETFNGKEEFRFYMLFNTDEVGSGTVGEYRKASRLYMLA